MKKVYLAGPDVFFPNANEHFDDLELRCARLGLQGCRPSDGGLSQGLVGTKAEVAERIYRANIALIAECSGVLANLMPFRNALEPDSGTVFEVGMAVALGKPVAGFLPQRARSYESKVIAECGVGRSDGASRYCAQHGYLLEEFEQPMNLMLARSATLFETTDEALAHLAKMLLPA